MKRPLSMFLMVIFVCPIFIKAVISPNLMTNQGEKITAEEVVAKYLEAIGGIEAIKKVKAKTIRYRVHMFARDGYVMERSWKRPNIMQTGLSGGKAYTLTEEEKSWRVSPEGRKEMPPAVSANFAKLADIDGPLVDSEKKGISIEYLGTEQYDMTNLHRLKLTFKDSIQWELFFDSSTGLLRRMKQPSFMMINNKITRGPDAVTYYFDYRPIENIKFPHLWLQLTDDHTHAFIVESIVLND